MIRLHITAEGQTEQSFAKKVLAPHLAERGVFADARCAGKRVGCRLSARGHMGAAA